MSSTPDMASCFTNSEERSELLPLSPFYALSYHFGMLLGVDDFETEQAYHRAKMRLHNGWLHREGVIWGFDVQTDQARGEVRVLPGLALDLAGRELHLETDACVNVGQWFEAHRRNAGFTITEVENGFQFDAHVVIRFKACLTRQVPALMEPCAGAGSDTAYSRVFETLEILLRPGRAPARNLPYHRLRLLFGLAAPNEENGSITPGDQQVLDELAAILGHPREDQPAAYLRAFYRFAALDEIELQPAKSADGERLFLFPGGDEVVVVLADITGITLERREGGLALTAGTVDTAVRPSHVATTTIQDLLCGPLFRDGGPAPGPAAAGPRVDPASIQFEDSTITFRVDSELHAASVTADAFAVTFFDDTGWQRSTIDAANFDGGTLTVTLTLNDPPGGSVVRLIARGTGETPLLGTNLVPLAGATSGPPATEHQGNDFVFMHRRS